jgi:hypothetical protein
MESSTFGRDTAWAMSQENVEIVRGLHEAFARGDNDTPFSVYNPEIEWDMTRLPLPGEESVYHGHDGVRRYWRAWLEAGSSSMPQSSDLLKLEIMWSRFSGR